MTFTMILMTICEIIFQSVLQLFVLSVITDRARRTWKGNVFACVCHSVHEGSLSQNALGLTRKEDPPPPFDIEGSGGKDVTGRSNQEGPDSQDFSGRKLLSPAKIGYGNPSAVWTVCSRDGEIMVGMPRIGKHFIIP